MCFSIFLLAEIAIAALSINVACFAGDSEMMCALKTSSKASAEGVKPFGPSVSFIALTVAAKAVFGRGFMHSLPIIVPKGLMMSFSKS